MIALLVISLVIGTIWTPQTRGKSLEQITDERYGKDDSAEATHTDTSANGSVK